MGPRRTVKQNQEKASGTTEQDMGVQEGSVELEKENGIESAELPKRIEYADTIEEMPGKEPLGRTGSLSMRLADTGRTVIMGNAEMNGKRGVLRVSKIEKLRGSTTV